MSSSSVLGRINPLLSIGAVVAVLVSTVTYAIVGGVSFGVIFNGLSQIRKNPNIYTTVNINSECRPGYGCKFNHTTMNCSIISTACPNLSNELIVTQLITESTTFQDAVIIPLITNATFFDSITGTDATYDGIVGTKGPPGFNGANGTVGNPGPIGNTGSDGPDGNPGAHGIDGEDGNPGADGIDILGPVGDAINVQGPIGDSVVGAQGPDGDSIPGLDGDGATGIRGVAANPVVGSNVAPCFCTIGFNPECAQHALWFNTDKKRMYYCDKTFGVTAWISVDEHVFESSQRADVICNGRASEIDTSTLAFSDCWMKQFPGQDYTVAFNGPVRIEDVRGSFDWKIHVVPCGAWSLRMHRKGKILNQFIGGPITLLPGVTSKYVTGTTGNTVLPYDGTDGGNYQIYIENNGCSANTGITKFNVWFTYRHVIVIDL